MADSDRLDGDLSGFQRRAGVVWRTAKLFWKFSFDKPAWTRPQGPVPVEKVTREGLLAAPDRALWRLGHSTVLMKLRGGFWLTDPVFAERASPVWFAGPKRFHRPPVSIAELPPLKAVVISHDHYDHLDKAAIKKLRDKAEWFIVPRGVGAIVAGWGVDHAKIVEREWWEHAEIGGLRLTSTPTQHFSGRNLFHRNETLWTSWAIEDGDFRIFYGADSGYFCGFEKIGERLGPFDVTLLENGAYNVRWPVVHMQPEETVRAHKDLRGRWLIPIHNGTFDLAMHAWTEPMERMQTVASREGVHVCTPRFGEMVRMEAMEAGSCWWREVESVPAKVPAAGVPVVEEHAQAH